VDIYKDSFFLQSGILGEHPQSFGFEFEDGSLFFLLSDSEDFINLVKDALSSFEDSDRSLGTIVKYIASKSGSLYKNAGIFFIFANSDGTIETASQNMPPFILKNKKDEIFLTDGNRNIFGTEIDRDVLKLFSEDVGIIIFVNSRRVINELKERCFSVFGKCELEDIIRPLSKRAEDLNIAYLLLNNTLKDRIKFAFKEKLPAKLKNIINYESELEKILRDSYSDEEITSDNALTIFNELILNAYEHGTLEVDSDTKQERILDGTYEEYINRLEAEKDS